MGIANQFGTLTIIDSTISGNTTGGGGGGIRIFNGVVTITGSTISHNTATAFASGGGGISNSSTSSSSLRLINSTISGNTAQAGGGALSNNSASAMTSLFNVTITNNTTSDGNGGGVVIISGVVTATNSLIAGNIDSGGQAPDCSGALTSAGHNLIGSTSFCNISGMTTGNLFGLDPLLGPLQDNGGATLTHALSSGSPAIDAGDPAGCKDDTGATLTIDQRSFPRPVGSGCDIGAWEQGQANLSLTLSDSPDPVTVGDPLVYSITIANNGPHTATAVLVSDALPSAVSLNALSASQGSCSQSGQDISCELGLLAISATASVTLTVTAVSAGSISNTASVASNEADTSLENNSDSETTTLNPSSNLSLVKSAAPDPAIVGAPMTYTLQVVNGASPVNGVVLTDTLPAAFSLRSVSTTSGSCSGSETIVCTIGSLAADATATVTIVGEPAAQGTLINTAVITGTPDSDPGNNSSSTSTTVSTLADLSVTQSDDPDPVGTGMPLTYTLTILNAGPSPATGIVLTDTLPFGVVFEAATTSQGSCSGTSTITCALDSLDSGASATVTIRGDGITICRNHHKYRQGRRSRGRP
ncbi:MAG: hypothetical protein KatS3mg057_0158 [Herpetosiphonaceae bacterium]|nr:MAG: hypothetical protein KatS3mg057_0158 [Herpetosiphonaceae bacterium]